MSDTDQVHSAREGARRTPQAAGSQARRGIQSIQSKCVCRRRNPREDQAAQGRQGCFIYAAHDEKHKGAVK
jgi:hypothetical protein